MLLLNSRPGTWRQACLSSLQGRGFQAPALLSNPALSAAHSQPPAAAVRSCQSTVCRAAATASAPTAARQQPASGQADFELACPICQQTEFSFTPEAGRMQQAYQCKRCQRTFSTTEPFVDLTTSAGMPTDGYTQRFWGGTEIFRSPAVSYAYERGWRQAFVAYGFPGPDRELGMALDYFQPVFGETLLDMSCGSGLFSRRFVKSRKFAGVIAADYSANMLKQTRQFFSEQADCDPRQFMLLRADVGRLPFRSESLGAIHAGAALHCWPNPSQAIAEIARVLKPGGVFVASTILSAVSPLGQLIGDDNTRFLSQFDPMLFPGTARAYKWWEEAEIKDLCATMGLKDYRRHRNNRFILFTVRKPGGSPSSS